MTVKDTIDLYETLVERACEVVSGPPYWVYVSEPKWARITINGVVATLHSFELATFYESPALDVSAQDFPAYLLHLSDAELGAWKAEKTREYDNAVERKKAADLQAAQVAKEAHDRAEYERLKLKFG